MSSIGAIGAAGSAMSVYRSWIDAVSDNIANIDTARPMSEEAFRPRSIVAGATDEGVEVTGVELGSAEGNVVYDPGNALADTSGMVRMPATDMADQMVQLMAAQRGYQANVQVIERARDAYRAALQIGQ